jgi:protein SCO1/2
MTYVSRQLLPIVFLLILLLFYPFDGSAQIANKNPQELEKIDVKEHLGETIPLDLEFVTSVGDTVVLSTFFHQGKPVILVLAYYNCPMLCTLVLNGMVEAARHIPLDPATDYQVVVVSIDSTETPPLAAKKKKNYVASLDRPGAEAGLVFTVGAGHSSRTLAQSVGFKYYWDEKSEQWAHPAVLVFLTPEGKISRYLYGIQYKPNDVRLGLLEASKGKVGSTLEKVILYCYHYDPDSQGYVLFAANVMKLGGIFTVAVLVIFLGYLWARERLRTHSN